jgi:hypothetical protein
MAFEPVGGLHSGELEEEVGRVAVVEFRIGTLTSVDAHANPVVEDQRTKTARYRLGSGKWGRESVSGDNEHDINVAKRCNMQSNALL